MPPSFWAFRKTWAHCSPGDGPISSCSAKTRSRTSVTRVRSRRCTSPEIRCDSAPGDSALQKEARVKLTRREFLASTTAASLLAAVGSRYRIGITTNTRGGWEKDVFLSFREAHEV